MSEPKDALCLADEEVAFWRGFIAWWEAKEGKPATPRMREALAYAQYKRSEAEITVFASRPEESQGRDFSRSP